MVLTATVVALARLPRFRTRRPETLEPCRLLALAYVGVLSHVFLDYLNNYGVRLLMPFSGRWFYGDAVFIIDPWLWIVLGAGIWWSRGRASRWAPRVALIVSAAYMVLMLWSAQAARQVVLDLWSSAGGAAPAAFMVGPVPLTPVRKGVIIDTGDSYRTGTFRWPGRLELDGTPVSKNADHPAVRRAREHAVVRGILVWARFPYYELEPVPGGTRVTLRDLRFGDRVGATTMVVPADQAQRRR
jgi:inner membrane protein